MKTFCEFGLCEPTLASLREAGFTAPTEVQQQAIGLIMAGKDLMASAQTGSGKTAAYAVPIVDRLKKLPRRSVRALVVVPTRELALQVKEQFERFGWHLRTVAIYGGTGYHLQTKAMNRGADVIVATPGRLLDLLQQRIVDLSAVETLVLDEADRLMDMGFMPQIRKIVAQIPKQRQTLMFSATIDRRIEQIAAEYLSAPEIVRSTANQIDPASIDQKIHHLHEFAKDDFLLQLLEGLDNDAVIVFTKTRRKATWVAERLRESNVSAEEIHGDVKQNKREKIMARYRQGDFTVLVATDVAARGLDIPHISHVVNYDLPTSAEDYVHRIGRTGRAGRSGIAHSFVSHEQRYLLRDIERVIGRRFESAQGPVSEANRSVKPAGRRRFRPGRRRSAV